MFRKSHIKFAHLFWMILLIIQSGQLTAGEKKRLRVGEIWTEDEDIPTGGWECTFVWPGKHWRRSDPSENILHFTPPGKYSGGFPDRIDPYFRVAWA